MLIPLDPMLLPDEDLRDALLVDCSVVGDTETITVSAWPPLAEPIPTQRSRLAQFLELLGMAP